MRYERKSRERGHMNHAKTQILSGFSGFEANPSSHITFIIRDTFPGEVE